MSVSELARVFPPFYDEAKRADGTSLHARDRFFLFSNNTRPPLFVEAEYIPTSGGEDPEYTLELIGPMSELVLGEMVAGRLDDEHDGELFDYPTEVPDDLASMTDLRRGQSVKIIDGIPDLAPDDRYKIALLYATVQFDIQDILRTYAPKAE